MLSFKKIFSVCFIFIFLFTALPFDASASAHGWYVKRNKDHLQPVLEPQFSYVEDYGGYYVDHRHGDEEQEKVLYLTFDAGYENGNVEKILDVLKAENVPGAFFILDHLLLRYQELVERMITEGHTVCNHTLRHKDMTALHDKEAFARELSALEELYYEKTGHRMARYYRPPEGRFSEENLKFAQELGYKTIFWSFAYADWDNQKQPSCEEAKKKILDNTHNGAVILLHPTSATNAAILGDLIREWRAQGYRFGTLDELTAEEAPTMSDAVYHVSCEEKLIALTFDDGPHPRYTERILSILEEHNAKATFFFVGENLSLYQRPALAVASAGHEIGNHTYTHPSLPELGEESLRHEIKKTAELLREMGISAAPLFRPPQGYCGGRVKAIAEDLGYQPILWDIDTRDWAGTPSSEIVENVMKHVHPGAILLFHDYVCFQNTTVGALSEILSRLEEDGYRFVTVSELLAHSASSD